MKNTKKYLLLISFFLAAFLERTVFDLGPNVELVTTAMILTAFYFGKKESFWLTLTVMVLSDTIIGNSTIFLFTWSGFLIPALLASKITKKFGVGKITKTLTLTGAGISSNLLFFFWTNFGVWLMGSMYPKTFAGLTLSFINGLPFLKPQIISTLLFVPLGFLITEKVLAISKSKSFQKSYSAKLADQID